MSIVIPATVALVFGALALGGRKKAAPTGAPPRSADELRRLADSRVAGQPVPHATTGVYLYQWARGAQPPSVTALDFARKSVKAGSVVWGDITLLGTDKFYLAVAPKGVRPQGEWFILAETERDLDTPPPVPGGSVPSDARPVTGPSDIPAPTTAPGTAAKSSGFPEIDELVRSKDATPYQLRQIAAELRRNGKTAEAKYVEDRATELYTSLRAKHAALGGTPFIVKDHHGKGVSGHLPDSVSRHYGGTLEQLRKANPSKAAWAGWTIGSEWLLPLSWDAEAKAPPPILGASKESAKKRPAAAGGKTKQAISATSDLPASIPGDIQRRIEQGVPSLPPLPELPNHLPADVAARAKKSARRISKARIV